MDIILSTFIIGEGNITVNSNEIEILKYNSIDDIERARGKYISFIDSSDKIDSDYFNCIINKIHNSEFDLCFINYKVNYKFKNELKVRHDNLENILPGDGSYIWNYVFNKSKLLEFINKKDNNIFKKRVSISKILYYHNVEGSLINICGLYNRHKFQYYKNIIYMGKFCNGLFNGYITWLNEIGKAFNYDITIIYTKINSVTKDRFSKYFNCIEYDGNTDYICNNLVTTYSTYFYPINIYRLDSSSLFIHGNMSDYPNSMKFKDDIYDRYIAVSKVSRDRAVGYFPTNNIEYIYNPYTYVDEGDKHLFLVSAFRNAPEKGMDRVKTFAGILDSLGIPYTWEVFTDVLEENKGGLVFRHSVTNTIDYIKAAQYLVQFSRTEALSYSLTEALCVNVKVITTDIPAIHELGVQDGVNGVVIPIEYFDSNNRELLTSKVREAYNIRNKTFNYSYDRERFTRYESVFSK